MRTITATIPAWITNGNPISHDEADIERVISNLSFWKPYDEKFLPDGWIKAGTAEITVTLIEEAEIVAGQVEMLKEAKKRIQANTQHQLNEIDEQISKLTCLEYKQ